MSRLLLPVMLCLVQVIASGCATTVQYVVRADPSALSSNKATVVICRDQKVAGGGIAYVVSDNGLAIGRLGPGGSLCWQRDPGEMTIGVDLHAWGSSIDRALYADTQAGRRYAYRLHSESMAWGWELRFESMDRPGPAEDGPGAVRFQSR